MAQLIPAFNQALDDPRLRHGKIREVYFFLHARLDVLQFREMKLEAIMAGLEIEKATASAARQKLVDLGYLDERASSGRSRAYRLVYSVVLARSA